MSPWVGVLAGACAATVIACAAGGQSRAVQPASAPVAGESVMPPGTHDQIAALDRRLTEQRRQMNLPEPPMAPSAPEIGPAAVMPVAACPAAPPDTCHDVCTLADSICDNAGKICELAKQMAGDAWAEGKCASANQTCGQAHERCCTCQ